VVSDLGDVRCCEVRAYDRTMYARRQGCRCCACGRLKGVFRWIFRWIDVFILADLIE
jgi:hypothetical protein